MLVVPVAFSWQFGLLKSSSEPITTALLLYSFYEEKLFPGVTAHILFTCLNLIILKNQVFSFPCISIAWRFCHLREANSDGNLNPSYNIGLPFFRLQFLREFMQWSSEWMLLLKYLAMSWCSHNLDVLITIFCNYEPGFFVFHLTRSNLYSVK